jgi:hypothetical protein
MGKRGTPPFVPCRLPAEYRRWRADRAALADTFGAGDARFGQGFRMVSAGGRGITGQLRRLFPTTRKTTLPGAPPMSELWGSGAEAGAGAPSEVSHREGKHQRQRAEDRGGGGDEDCGIGHKGRLQRMMVFVLKCTPL